MISGLVSISIPETFASFSDGKTSTIDVYKSKSNLYSNIFADNKENAAKAEEIAQQQSEILAKYAGEDGVLSSEEYSEAVQTSEYKR